MSTYQQVFENNRRWAAETAAAHDGFFARLAEGQDPEFLFIGCADSRVPATQVTGLGPGDIFVHRNVANLVVHTDANIQSVIEYAVAHLGVRHVVVCGHYGCGGVAAAMGPQALGVLDPWLRAIRDVYLAHKQHLDAIESWEERHRELVRINVRTQVNHIAQSTSIQKAWAAGEGPQVHGWVFELATGLLEDLYVEVDRAALAQVYGPGSDV